MPRQMPKKGIVALAGELDGGDLPLGPALAEAAGNENARAAARAAATMIGFRMLEHFGIDPLGC